MSTAAGVRVVTAAQAAACDRAAIDAGTPSYTLMTRAGEGAAREIVRRFGDRLDRGLLVLTGGGNNGGDGWVVARLLGEDGVAVTVAEVAEPRTDDAKRAKAEAAPHAAVLPWRVALGARRPERVLVDAMLGTGASGSPRGDVAAAIESSGTAAAEATVVALDLPTGLDASTGASEGAVRADLTISFGTMKRGALVSRGACGVIVVLDIGLGPHAELPDGAPVLMPDASVRALVPPIAADAHKGSRAKLLVAGGSEGMAGASVLAGRAALRSGAGMVRLLVAPESLRAVQAAEPAALASTWPEAMMRDDVLAWSDALVLGPGLGKSDDARGLLERLTTAFQQPMLLDADALNLLAGHTDALARICAGREVVITPHPAEMARLAGTTVEDVLARRFEIGAEFARHTGAVVLLKGTPTVVSTPDGQVMVVARGTPTLATAGSGDVLSGVIGALLGQVKRAADAAIAGAWAHGRAAERAGERRAERLSLGSEGAAAVRGLVLDDVVAELGDVWPLEVPAPAPGVLAELPRVGEEGLR